MSPTTSETNGRMSPSNVPDDIYQRLVESTRDYAMFVLDTTGLVRTWTEGARAIKGYSATEIIGSHFSRFYPEDQVARGWPDYELAQAASLGRFEDENWR